MTMERVFMGDAGQSSLVPALVRAPLPTPRPPNLKHFLPFPVDNSPPLSLIPAFSSMGRVQKAVLLHTLCVPASSERKSVCCSVCQLRFNSKSQALAHYKGTKHAKKLKSLDTPKCLKHKSWFVSRENADTEPPTGLSLATTANHTDRNDLVASSSPPALLSGPSSSPSGAESTSVLAVGGGPSLAPNTPRSTETTAEEESEEEKALRLLYCSLCKVGVNSASQLEAHNSGTKHKTMLEARSGNGCIKSFPRPGLKSKMSAPTKTDTGLQNKMFHCETCDVHVNSETQLKQHINSRRHKDRVAGKPAKPKFCPYSKTQRGPTKHTLKISAAEVLCPALMSSRLSAVAPAVGSAFQLRVYQNPAPFQTQPLPAMLLHSAPGPIRTAHMPLLFDPINL